MEFAYLVLNAIVNGVSKLLSLRKPKIKQTTVERFEAAMVKREQEREAALAKLDKLLGEETQPKENTKGFTPLYKQPGADNVPVRSCKESAQVEEANKPKIKHR